VTSETSSVRLSVVIPAFREARRIAATVSGLRSALTDPLRGSRLEIVVVDDGSPDATAVEAQAAGADQVIRLPVNRGKGAAVRAGVLAANGDTVAFTDADLSYRPAQLLGLLEEAERGWDVVVGNRHAATSSSALGLVRRVSHLGFQQVARLALRDSYGDTQCGIKAFRADAARRIFSATRVDGFAFDVELFLLAERYGLRIREVPVEVVDERASTVNVGPAALSMVFDILRLRRWDRAGVYGASK
jgi:glycosyltransferase involved in cell wall biosynthesis